MSATESEPRVDVRTEHPSPSSPASPGGPPRTIERRRRQRSPGLVASSIVTYVVLIVMALVYIYPFLISIASSFKTDADATQNPLALMPETWSFAAYERLFTTCRCCSGRRTRCSSRSA